MSSSFCSLLREPEATTLLPWAAAARSSNAEQERFSVARPDSIMTDDGGPEPLTGSAPSEIALRHVVQIRGMLTSTGPQESQNDILIRQRGDREAVLLG